MDYVTLVTDSIHYIDRHEPDELSLETLASRYSLSRFFFSRLFHAVTHRKLRDYLEEHRLHFGAAQLRDSGVRIIDVAVACGYSSHAAFTRQFQRCVGMGPAEYRRKGCPPLSRRGVEIPLRQFKNQNRDLVVDWESVSLEDRELHGRGTRFSPADPASRSSVAAAVGRFVERHVDERADALYGVVDGDRDAGAVRYFYGRTYVGQTPADELDSMSLVGGLYARFAYRGTMGDIFETVADDICRWLIVTGVELRRPGFDFYEYYDARFAVDGTVCIYLPIASDDYRNRNQVLDHSVR